MQPHHDRETVELGHLQVEKRDVRPLGFDQPHGRVRRSRPRRRPRHLAASAAHSAGTHAPAARRLRSPRAADRRSRHDSARPLWQLGGATSSSGSTHSRDALLRRRDRERDRRATRRTPAPGGARCSPAPMPLPDVLRDRHALGAARRVLDVELQRRLAGSVRDPARDDADASPGGGGRDAVLDGIFDQRLQDQRRHRAPRSRSSGTSMSTSRRSSKRACSMSRYARTSRSS